MGVDFYVCDHCYDTFPDCAPYFYCNKCSNFLCDDCERKLVPNDYPYEDDGPIYDEEDANNWKCPFCRKEIVSDDDLLSFALEQLGLTYEELVARYKGV